MRRLLPLAALLAAWLGGSGPADAHTRSVSYSTWTMRTGGATVTVKLSALDQSAVQAAAGLVTGDAAIGDALQRAIGLESRGGCAPAPGSFQELTASRGWYRYEWELRCADTLDLRIHSDLLFDVVPAHIHFARVDVGGTTAERVLTEGTRDAAVAAMRSGDESPVHVAGRYVGIGIDHILSGWDHLVFLLTLVLVARRLREVAVAVTGFTLGHSITLAMAVLGFATPVQGTIEALIGLSIALVAVENVWLAEQRRSVWLPVAAIAATLVGAGYAAGWGTMSGWAVLGLALFAACYFAILHRSARPIRLRCGVAAVFGLVHGFGFAGALKELALGADHIVFPLLGFNVGVELGQFAVLSLVWPALVLVRRLAPRRDLAVIQWGSAITLGLGVFWFVSRA